MQLKVILLWLYPVQVERYSSQGVVNTDMFYDRIRSAVTDQFVSILTDDEIGWETFPTWYFLLDIELPSLSSHSSIEYERLFVTKNLKPVQYFWCQKFAHTQEWYAPNLNFSESGHGESPYSHPPDCELLQSLCIWQHNVTYFSGWKCLSVTSGQGCSLLSGCLKKGFWKTNQRPELSYMHQPFAAHKELMLQHIPQLYLTTTTH